MGGKKIKGRKRHLAPDTLGNMLTVQVHAANGADTSQGWDVCDRVAEKSMIRSKPSAATKAIAVPPLHSLKTCWGCDSI